MFRNSVKLAVLLLLLIFVTIAISACGSSSEPEDRQFDLEITEGTLNLESDAMEVKQGDTVTLSFGSDEHGSVHLHGYDIEKDVGPDETATMEFIADATGRFNITFHAGGEDEHEEEEEEVSLGSLEVRPR